MEEPDQVHGCSSAKPWVSSATSRRSHCCTGHHARGHTRVADREQVRPSWLPDRHLCLSLGRGGERAFTAAALSPAEGHVLFGYAGIAVYDAVMAVRHKYEPFAIRTNAPRGASPEAAVVAAAHRIYEHYLPVQKATILDPAYDASLATIPDGQAKAGGVAAGLRVANALIALRADDGFRKDVGYTPPDPEVPGTGSQPLPHLPSGHTSARCNLSAWSPQTSSDPTDLPHSGADDGLATTTRSRRSARGRARLASPGRRRQPHSGQSYRFNRRTSPCAESSSNARLMSSKLRG